MFTVYLAMLSSEEDRERFTLLYEAHEKRLYAVALKILGNPTRAEDAAQQGIKGSIPVIHCSSPPAS